MYFPDYGSVNNACKGLCMFFKKGKDYIYVIKQGVVVDPESEVTLHKDSCIELKINYENDKKNPFYYRVILLNKNAKVTQFTKHILVLSIPRKKLPNKMIGNYTSQDLALCEYTFNNVGYIVFGKSCTEENI